MVTLKLKKSPAPQESVGPKRPARGSSAPRHRPTLAEAQAARAERAERERALAEPPSREPGRPDARWDHRSAAGSTPRDDGPRRAAPPERAAPHDRTRPEGPPRGEAQRSAMQHGNMQRSAIQEQTPRPRHGPGPERGPGPARGPASATQPQPLPQQPPAGSAQGERLSKRMTTLGLASRREADEWIEAGWVKVDGRLAVLGQRVGPDAQIWIDPAAHRQQAQRVTILLHKPIGYVSGQAEDGHEPAAALIRRENQWAEDRSGLRWHPGHLRSLAPAGRLDIDSTGLLVLTQDGRIARQLIGDESLVEKEYLVRVRYTREGSLPDADLALLNHGLSLDDHVLRPAKVSWANEDQLRFVLREGRKRQIRRMCEAVGLEVLALKRVRIGSVPLGHLPPGQWRYLRRDEFFA
ncbi:MAG: rRNA pseudouridine synthase [Leptothrix sp. (in: Bacteria)]|nr:rRNA pseudouridine synthase [Leptothrix sp. (in: b-proteobacteria)]